MLILYPFFHFGTGPRKQTSHPFWQDLSRLSVCSSWWMFVTYVCVYIFIHIYIDVYNYMSTVYVFTHIKTICFHVPCSTCCPRPVNFQKKNNSNIYPTLDCSNLHCWLHPKKKIQQPRDQPSDARIGSHRRRSCPRPEKVTVWGGKHLPTNNKEVI